MYKYPLKDGRFLYDIVPVVEIRYWMRSRGDGYDSDWSLGDVEHYEWRAQCMNWKDAKIPQSKNAYQEIAAASRHYANSQSLYVRLESQVMACSEAHVPPIELTCKNKSAECVAPSAASCND